MKKGENLAREKAKKISAKKEKYSKFKKTKEANASFTPYNFSDEEMKEVRDEETRVEKFFKFARKKEPHEIVMRREFDKR